MLEQSPWHDIPAFLLTTDPLRSLFCVFLFTDQSFPEGCSWGSRNSVQHPAGRPFIHTLIIARIRGCHSHPWTLCPSLFTSPQLHLFIHRVIACWSERGHFLKLINFCRAQWLMHIILALCLRSRQEDRLRTGV